MSSGRYSALENLSQTELFQKVGAICTTVTSVINEKELLDVSLQQIIALFGATRGSIFILNNRTQKLVLQSAQGMKVDEARRFVKELGEGIVGQVAQLKRPIFVEDITKDDRFKGFKQRGRYKTPSFICSPLMIKDQVMGVINIADKETGHRFNHQELQLLDFLTSQIALNYRRIQLYRKFKKVLKETQDLKEKLGQSNQETRHLKRQMDIQERLATIGKLAGGIAHEFNNPLDGVIRYTNLCLEHIKDEDVVYGYLVEVKQGLNRMANIVKNLLACSRDDPLREKKVGIRGTLEQALSALKTELSCKNIRVEKEISEKLPMIEDLGFERILTNLLRNAVDAMDDGGTLSLRASAKNGEFTMAISDTGCGIPKENIDQIFEPFFTTKDIDKGCGLGLTIVSEIVKSYDGKVEVESKVGQGTTFTVRLPTA